MFEISITKKTKIRISALLILLALILLATGYALSRSGIYENINALYIIGSLLMFTGGSVEAWNRGKSTELKAVYIIIATAITTFIYGWLANSWAWLTLTIAATIVILLTMALMNDASRYRK